MLVLCSNHRAPSVSTCSKRPLILWLWAKAKRQNQERYNIPITSGLVTGELLVKALLAMLATGIGLLSAK